MFELVDAVSQQAVIKVIGVGGGGGNAVNFMLDEDFEGVEFISANTDAQMLGRSKCLTRLQLGENLTRGLGAGADREVGRQAAEEDSERIAEAIEGADMVFITAGMGGGTGTGASPVIARLARKAGILTVAVVTKPFPFEGKNRTRIAEEGIEELKAEVDSLITIPNEKVLAVSGQDATMVAAFKKANEVLFNAVQGISELIIRPGLINVDFADVRTVMSEMGEAMMGSATTCGENRASEAAKAAISSPLLEDANLNGAKGLLVNITAGPDMAIGEFEAVGNAIGEYAAVDANVVIGTAFDPAMEGNLRVTMVATGLVSNQPKAQAAPKVLEHPVQSASPVSESQDADKLPDKRQHRTYSKRVARHGLTTVQAAAVAENYETNYEELDIPAFLRAQAD